MSFLFSSTDFSSIARSTSGGFAAGIDVESTGGPNGGSGRTLALDVNGSASATGAGGAAVYGLVTGNNGRAGGLLSITVGPPPKSDLIAANGVLSGSGDMTSGIEATGKGGNGSDGASFIAAAGDDGGVGGTGATVGVNVTSGNWNITSNGVTSPGVLLQSYGGNGGNGGSSTCCNGGFGGKGAQGGTVSFESESPSGQVTISTGQNDQASPGLLLISQAGSGGKGGSSDAFGKGGKGGAGGGGGPVTVLANHLDITTDLNSIYSPGVAAYSLGGTGGNGGNGGVFNSGSADGGGTGASGPVTVTVQQGNILTKAANSAGIIAQSISGHAGTGGGGGTVRAATFGAAGGSAGKAGNVAVTNGATIRTSSDQSVAIFAQSAGGGGGNGGNDFGLFYSQGGNGGNGGDGGTVLVNNDGSLSTSGADSQGIFAQSVGGAGGDGGAGNHALVAVGGRARYGSNGGTVTVTNSGPITTGATRVIKTAEFPICGVGCSEGILAQSVGGGGGEGGASNGWFSVGGTAGGGGNGGAVNVNNIGNIATGLANSAGIAAQSIGGGGGDGGSAISGGPIGSFALGASGGAGGTGGSVNVQATSGMEIGTAGADSAGIFAQSVGGGGGDAGYAAAVTVPTPAGVSVSVSLGGTGAAGGNGQSVTVNTIDPNYSGLRDRIGTKGNFSDGILAQSIGGGGGNGGFAVAFSGGVDGIAAALAVGGKGGAGGNGGAVSLTSNAQIATAANESSGLVAQSIGGGGGNGGLTLSGTLQLMGNGVSVAVGGSGNGGGSASTVDLVDSGSVTTSGTESDGVLAQSIGGRGGDGGITIAASLGGGGSGNLAVAVGGTGGGGGNGGAVSVMSDAQIATLGYQASGLVAESIGGGGGNGGLTISGAAQLSGAALSVAIGGSGSGGGSASHVDLVNSGSVVTANTEAYGVLAQSIGGQGGDGGLTISGTTQLTGLGVGVAIGGSGRGGGSASTVDLTNSGRVTTSGTESDGVVAQSIGGRGGDGGITIAPSLSGGGKFSGNVTVAVGGSGGSSGNAGRVMLDNSGAVTVTGPQARGLDAESIGGTGGNGGLTISAELTGSSPKSLSLAVGGDGGVSGNGGDVALTNTAAVQTGKPSLNPAMVQDFPGISGSSLEPEMPLDSPGIVASSVGGGGGDGSWTGAIALGATSGAGPSIQAAVTVGGRGGAGGNAGQVTLENSGSVTTYANVSPALLGSSIGGGGGDAGYLLAGTAIGTGQNAFAASVAVGQSGGNGGAGGAVQLTNDAALKTFGMDSDAIKARSEGGGGGSAGAVVTLNADVNVPGQAAIGVAVGGGGGSGSIGRDVAVENSGVLTTAGKNSDGIRAESVGGTGGDGALTVSGGVQLKKGCAGNVAVGGDGGKGNTGGNVTVTSSGPITTTGDNANGIDAQSTGGGGGNALMSVAAPIRASVGLKMSLGGVGGTGANAGEVQVENGKAITTTGAESIGIFAQSEGGGGGASQANTFGLSGSGNGLEVDLGVTLGLPGGSSGNGGLVTVTNSGVITTGGVSAGGVSPDGDIDWNQSGVVARSIGGGGGSGGSAFSLIPGITAEGDRLSFAVNIGGKGGAAGTGGTVTVNNTGAITTFDTESYGIAAQSVGGGGGSGGGAATAPGVLYDKSNSLNIGMAVGGEGGEGNTGGPVTVNNAVSVITHGDGSHGIYAQSVGGGGGDGGSAFNYFIGGLSKQSAATINLKLALGGDGGDSGSGRTVKVTNKGTVTTTGNGANGIEAQSIGGGGGEAGNASSVTASRFPFQSLNVNVGGTGGSGNNGGAVTIDEPTTSAAITTTGSASTGLYAQSVGGGGGRGGVGVYARITTLSLGGQGGANGNGGAVTVDGAGTITTQGSGTSDGIFAQSVGGGGGQAGGFGLGIIDAPYLGAPPVDIGTSIPMGIPGKSSGNGGTVGVAMVGSITTTGDDAIGIYAQSVGGGGGIRGQADDPASCPAPCTDLVGSLGNTGSAGRVKVGLGGTLTTDGQYSHGIFAQSAAGTASPAGNVTVGINPGASLLVNGADADAIFAQSVGGTSGDISVFVSGSAMVQGGSGNSSYGIHFLDGARNVLNNDGTITTLNGVNGVAVRTDGGNTTVNNFGTIIGDTDLNDGFFDAAGGFLAPERITNTGQIIGYLGINNAASAAINGGSGSTFGSFSGGAINVANGNLVFAGGNTDLGDNIAVNGGAGKVTNFGLLRLGASETVGGNFFQTGSGTFDSLIGGDALGQYGALTVTGDARLQGHLELDLTNGFALHAGDSFDLFNFADSSLTSPPDDLHTLTFDGANCLEEDGDMWSCSNLGSLDLVETISATSLDINVVVASAFVAHAAPNRAVPEPPSLVMLTTGLLGLAGIGMRRRRRSAP